MNAGKRARGFKKNTYDVSNFPLSLAFYNGQLYCFPWEPASGQYDRGEDRHDIPGGCLLRNLAGHKTLKYI